MQPKIDTGARFPGGLVRYLTKNTVRCTSDSEMLSSFCAEKALSVRTDRVQNMRCKTSAVALFARPPSFPAYSQDSRGAARAVSHRLFYS